MHPLRPAIRKQLIFRGDESCYREAKRASDGFEHGYLGFDELRKLATVRRDQTGTYLRDAIIETVGCDTALQGDLRQKALAVGAWYSKRVFRGFLLGSGENLAAPGQEYPILRWKSSIQRAAPTPAGGIAFSPSEEMTPRLASGISLRLGSYGVVAPDVGVKRESPPQITPKIIEGVKHDPAREQVIGVIEKICARVLDYSTGTPFEATAHQALILAIFAECRSQFQGIALLLKNGLANEALQLAHSLLRNALRLQFLTGIEDKTSVLIGWLRDSLDSGHDVQLAAVDGGFADGPAPSRDELEEKRRKLEEKSTKSVVGFSSRDISRDEVGPLGWLGYLVSRRILSGFGAMMSYQKGSLPKNEMGFNNICEDTEFIAFVASFAGESVLLACQSAGKLLGWPNFEGLDYYLELVRSKSFGKPPLDGKTETPTKNGAP